MVSMANGEMVFVIKLDMGGFSLQVAAKAKA